MLRPFWASLLFVLICFSGIGFAMAYEFAVGNISSRVLGIGLLALVGCLIAVVVLRRGKLGSHTPSETGRQSEASLQVNVSMRIVKAAVVVLPILLIIGMWLTRGQPLIPRLTGVAVNLFFTFWLISILRRTKKATGKSIVRAGDPGLTIPK